jgi:hypothetical protein
LLLIEKALFSPIICISPTRGRVRRHGGIHFVGDTMKKGRIYACTVELRRNVITRLLFGNRAETDRQAIPAVDGNNGERQVDQLFVGKLLAYRYIRLVRYVVKGN